MTRTRIRPVFLGLLVLCPNVAQAWLRPHHEDAIVAERSELIVVAHLKGDSIQYVPHGKKPHEGSSWEHHATLLVKEVLKGKCDEKEIPIVIHYGLTPVTGGYVKRARSMIDFRRGREDYPEDIIEIVDTGNSAVGQPPLVKDAREDNLWFLRKRSGIYGREPGTGKYGIVDPEDLQPLEWKDYFLAYMTDDPEVTVKEWSEKNPSRAGRAKRYFDHLEVERILGIKDPGERYDKLLPFFFNRTAWNMKNEPREGIISCGTIAGERLREVFDNPKHADFRDDIILMWREIGYREAVPILIDLLDKHDQFWAKQDLKKGWRNVDVGSDQTRRRSDTYNEVYYGVYALRAFRDPKSREIIEITRDRWKAMDFDSSQIVEECEAALRELAERKGATQKNAPTDADKPLH